MENITVLLMEKNEETGVFEKEVASVSLKEDLGYIYKVFVVKKDNFKKIVLYLTVLEDCEDWEYNAIFDYYDSEPIELLGVSLYETEGENPIWRAELDLPGDQLLLEEVLNKIINIHKKELESVYEAIADKKDEYCEI